MNIHLLYFYQLESYACLAPHIISVIFGTISGGVHYHSWNYTFINSNGQLLWRICSVVLTIYPTILAIFLIFDRRLEYILKHGVWRVIFFVVLTLYITARNIYFFLVVVSFWSLPVGVYDELSWSYFIPHF